MSIALDPSKAEQQVAPLNHLDKFTTGVDLQVKRITLTSSLQCFNKFYALYRLAWNSTTT